ncbi:ABC transporter substrate-binding protein [Williamsia sp.]|uniref:iron-siderophore ABC transporter substrate-binding protein n=1 Tax=Williamsia sp. TaxID=1872085 RepID=UPI002F9560DF
MTRSHMRARDTRRRAKKALGIVAALTLLTGLAAACSSDSSADEPQTSSTSETEATDSFPLTVEHEFGSTTIESEPKRVVSVGYTEQDILLQLGVVPIAVTEWYGDQPYAVWPWAQELLGDNKPGVLSVTDGFQYEKIAALEPDLIIGTNAGMDQTSYDQLSQLAPTVGTVKDASAFFSNWQAQTRLIASAVGRSAAGDDIVTEVEDAYARARSEHPEFAGLSATFTQGAPYDGSLYTYPAGLNTDFLTDLGFVITPGLEKFSPEPDSQALISAENVELLDADVMVFATETQEGFDELMKFGTLPNLNAVKNGNVVYTDPTLAGAIYFLTPLSHLYSIENLVPALSAAVKGEAPQSFPA